MKTVAYAATAALLMADNASAQSAPNSDLTRMLNGAPPAATPPANRPAAAPTATSAPRTAPSATTATPSTTATPPRPVPSAVVPTARPATATAPTSSSTRTAPAPATTGTTTRPVAPPATTPAAVPTSPPPAPPTVLNAAAVAALPFTVDLPNSFQITTGRPGPDFNVYAIRKGGRSFVTIYVGPSSQFPIYTGEAVELSGRSSIVVVDDGRRRAVEHLFRRDNPAQEIHAWVASLEGADAAQAEQIAQSISPR